MTTEEEKVAELLRRLGADSFFRTASKECRRIADEYAKREDSLAASRTWSKRAEMCQEIKDPYLG